MEKTLIYEFIKLLDPGLDYIGHELLDDTIIIRVVSNKKELLCPYCGYSSSKRHSSYERSFQVLPITGKKSRLIIHNRKMFCLILNVNIQLLLKHSILLSQKRKKAVVF